MRSDSQTQCEGNSDRSSNRNCPRCGSSQRTILVDLNAQAFCGMNSTYRLDYPEILGISADSAFPISRCQSCRFVYASWLPPQEFLSRVYDAVIDTEIGFRESLRPSWLGHLLGMTGAVLKNVDLTGLQAEHPLRVLDFGCGYGAQMRALSGLRYPYMAVGFETSDRTMGYLKAAGLTAESSLESVEALGPYHIVILSEVLEHVPDFNQVLRFVVKNLVPNGLVWISVPDFSDARLAQSISAAKEGKPFPRDLNPWEHLNYFSPKSLHACLRENGLIALRTQEDSNLGFQADLKGLKRMRNVAGVLKRLCRNLLLGPPLSTSVIATKGAIDVAHQ